MNISHIIKFTLTCASLMLVTGCSPSASIEEPPLAGARIGGAFTLTDQDGRSVSDTKFAGRYRLIYFGYSFCPDVCPVDLNWLMLGLKRFEQRNPAAAARVQPIFITVDPERDTPAAIKPFIAQFHPRLIGLTGTPAQIADVAAKYLVRYQRQPGSRPDAYLVSHTQLAYLMGPNGEPIALIPVDDVRTMDVNEGEPEAVANELSRWVR
jgi:protein SCO1/2